jgi:hypothetical protein
MNQEIEIKYLEASDLPKPVALRIVRGDGKGTQCPRVQLGYHVPGGYKYGDVTLQVGGVSDETVILDYGSCSTRISE